MSQNYWLDRWERGETGFHQTEVEPILATFFSKLKPTRVLVPLCGKSLDMVWLASRNHEVIGVELSTLACEQFFSENKIPYQKTQKDSFVVFHSEKITILNGDFFTLQASHLGEIGAIYDRAALIALPSEIRSRYASQIIQLMQKSAKPTGLDFLQIVLEYNAQDTQGPPFSISQDELERLYGCNFTISRLSRERLDGERFGNEAYECVYRLDLI